MEAINCLENCRICPRNCKINRFYETGFCGCHAQIKINTWQPHYGEEPYISGTNGSGTIFFSGCNLACVFCQNYQISQKLWGQHYQPEKVVQIMLELQEKGVHNINLVTPTHFSRQLADVIISAQKAGLRIPLVWNTNAYEKITTLQKLAGLVDIYLADYKYSDPAAAQKYSQAPDYPRIARQAILEMYRQVGDIQLDHNGLAQKGLAIRVLVLPHDLNSTRNSLEWLADNIGNQVYLSLMSQYYPTWKAVNYPLINRSLTSHEYAKAVETAEKLGFQNCLIQELNPSAEWTPEFDE